MKYEVIKPSIFVTIDADTDAPIIFQRLFEIEPD